MKHFFNSFKIVFSPLDELIVPLSIRFFIKEKNIKPNVVFIDPPRKGCDMVAIETLLKIKAKKIIIATHFPIIDNIGYYFIKQHQSKSYLIALKNAKSVNGMYIDENNKNGEEKIVKTFLSNYLHKYKQSVIIIVLWCIAIMGCSNPA